LDPAHRKAGSKRPATSIVSETQGIGAPRELINSSLWRVHQATGSGDSKLIDDAEGRRG